MPTWVSILIIAIGGAMLVEGACYALFPSAMKRAMAELQNMPESTLRRAGLLVAFIGVILVFLLMPKT